VNRLYRHLKGVLERMQRVRSTEDIPDFRRGYKAGYTDCLDYTVSWIENDPEFEEEMT